MVIATGSHPAGVATEALEVVACDLFEDSCHIPHLVQGLQLFNVKPFLVFTMLHGIEEGLAVFCLLLTIHGANLVGIVTANDVQEVPLPS